MLYLLFSCCAFDVMLCVFRLQPSERRKHRNRRKRERKRLLQSTRQKQRTSLKSSNQEWANTSTWLPREFTHICDDAQLLNMKTLSYFFIFLSCKILHWLISVENPHHFFLTTVRRFWNSSGNVTHIYYLNKDHYWGNKYELHYQNLSCEHTSDSFRIHEVCWNLLC